ncbi:13056_t:CDS:2, partial [Cetraspora pellucida]
QWNVHKKLAIITFLEKHSSNSVCATATHFNIEPKQLNNRRPPKYPELENKIYGWVKDLRSALKPVTQSMIWHYYNDWLDNGIITYTKTGRIQCPAYNLVTQWILQTWNNTDSNLI